MPSESGERYEQRLAFLMAILLGFTLLLVARLFYWQVIRHTELRELARESQRIPRSPALLVRGEIRDRNGHLLAKDIFDYQVSAAPSLIYDTQQVADRLALVLNLPRQRIWEQLNQKEAPYVLLEGEVPFKVGQTIKSWKLKGITVTPKPRRVYPLGGLLSHVLGFVGFEGDGRVGYYGVEAYYDPLLRGNAAPEGGGIFLGRETSSPPQLSPHSRNATTLILSIDRNIQYIVDRELRKAMAEYEATGGTIIVMDPKSGGILAMVSYPSYDPSQYERIAESQPGLFINPAVSSQYEPGSVFKIVTMSAALDSGLVTPKSTYNDKGSIAVGGRIITNWDRRTYGIRTMEELLQYSLNVGATTLSVWMGKPLFYEYVHRFGFGEETGVGMAGEIPGTVRLPGGELWHESDLATNAFGQGIAVTPLQMLTAASAVANGGRLMRPYVVEKIIENGVVKETQPVVLRQVISEETAQQLTEMLVNVVEKGAKLARVEGYRIAAKTGTASIPDPKRGGYELEATIASFTGYAPADDPQLAVLVKIDRPKTSPWGATVAAPVFKSLAEQLFALLGIPPDEVRFAMSEG